MIGFPKVFSTKHDFYNARALFPEQTKAKLKEIMDGRFIWVKDHELTENETGITDLTHKVIKTAKDTSSDMENREEVLVQLVLVEDEHSEFARLGWTVDEANMFLAN